ncbi:DNA endonuclease SmrA [Pseudoalteromonas mariniglutinosa]|uniref:DNA endonuclease SmrA n=1 Tax=Pseudoalteromonas mariniglutinosa TaxID=206042 RepID=UPI00384D3CC7
MAVSDFELFFSAMDDVTPLKHDTIKLNTVRNKPTLAQQLKRAAAECDLSIDENYLRSEHVDFLEPQAALSFKKQGVQGQVFKNLRLAKYQLDATLDLHGQTLLSARQALLYFVNDCHKHNIRVVLIRHGIGVKNKTQPAILKSYINKWLQELPNVLAFHSALRHHGGSGATYVMLKKSDEKKHENREIHSKRS